MLEDDDTPGSQLDLEPDRDSDREIDYVDVADLESELEGGLEEGLE